MHVQESVWWHIKYPVAPDSVSHYIVHHVVLYVIVIPSNETYQRVGWDFSH